jgi:hypothetical protein
MPKYRITAPDGKSYDVTAPEGATQEQVLAYVKSQQASAPTANNSDFGRMVSGAPPESAAQPGFMDKIKYAAQGELEGLKQGALGMAQTALAGNPGAMAGRKVAEMMGVDPNNPQDILARLAEKVGGVAGASRQDFADTPAGQTTVGQLGVPVGQFGSALALPGGGATLPQKLAVGGLGGVATAALQPVEGGDYAAEKTQQAALAGGFGVGGQGIASGTKALAGGAVAGLDEAAQALAKKAEAMGIPLSMRQLSENPMARTVLSQLERLPFSGAGKRAQMENEAFSRAVGSTFGAKGRKLTQEAFSEAKKRISATFETLSARNSLRLTPRLTQEVNAIRNEALTEGTTDAGRMVSAKIDALLAKSKKGAISGKAYQSLDSEIGDLMKGGGYEAYYLGKLRDTLRAGMDRSVAPSDQAQWKAARAAWANMKTVEPLVAKSATGELSPAALMQRVTSDEAKKIMMAAGRGGTLGDLARIGKKFLRESPDSGTADRALVNRALANVGTAGGLYGAQSAGVISPEQAAWMGAALIGNRYGLKALNSRALTQGGNPALKGLAGIASPLPKLLPPAALTYQNDD